MSGIPGLPEGWRRQHRHGGLLSPVVGIVTTGHDVADARLHRTVSALRRAGCEVWVQGLVEPDASKVAKAASTSLVEPGSPELASSASTPLVEPGSPELARAASVSKPAAPAGKLKRGIRALLWPWQARCDVLVTIDPDTALSAWVSSKVLRRRWVADVHEDYRELLRDRAWVPKPLLAMLRGAVSVLNRVITRADLVLVADDHVPPRSARSRFVMRNVPDVTLLPPMPLSPPGSTSVGRAVYVGDNRSSRGLRTMVEAIAATAADDVPWHLDLIGPVAAADREWFTARMAQSDTRNITWHGRQAPAEAWRIAAGANVGLCLLADTPAFRDAMPSKVYEYLAMGMSTVATPLPRVRELVEGTGAGVVVDGVPAVVEQLREFASNAEHRAALVRNARAAGQELRERPSPYDEAARRITELARADV